MFDFDAGKILIVGIVALIFIPPKDLPRVLRQVGQFVGKMKRMASEFQGQFMDAMREADMADLRKEAQKLADSAKIDVGLPTMHDLTRDLEAKPAMRPLPPADRGAGRRGSGRARGGSSRRRARRCTSRRARAEPGRCRAEAGAVFVAFGLSGMIDRGCGLPRDPRL